MYLSEETLDDVLMELFKAFVYNPSLANVRATKGSSKEIFGALIELKNPRARLSRSELKGTPYSCIGELCWYLSGSNDLSHMQYYISRYDEFSDDGSTVHGAYGPRLFEMHGQYNQVENIVQLLKRKRSSRRAIIQIFDASDLERDFKDVPCTTTLQFVVRNSKLDMMVHMRSNDIYLGLPHDIFCFTMFQEIISRKLNIDLGVYKHSVGSLHLYDCDIEKAKKYINEGWQRQIPMPEMPDRDIEWSLDQFLKIEKQLRSSENNNISQMDNKVSEYWKDLMRLLKAFNISKTTNDVEQIRGIREELIEDLYQIYIEKIEDRLQK